MTTTIDTLQLEITSNSSSAYDEIEKLATSLTNLTASSRSLNTVAKRLTSLNSALAGLKTSSSGLSNLAQITTALNGMNSISGKGLSSAINQLKKIPEVTSQLKTEAIVEFSKKMNELSNALDPVAIKLDAIGTEIQNINVFIKGSKFDKLTKDLQNVEKTSKKTTSIFSKLKKLFHKFAGVLTSFGLGNALQNPILSINEYIENMNLFKVSMGEFYNEAKEYAELLQDKMGIDSSEWMRSQGVFMSMATGFGLANGQAYKLSKGMTELSYDMSSFYNIPIEESLTKMRSALAGEIEPLRQLGISLTEATLKELALEKGITKNVEAMTEGEKAQLRYVAIVEKASSQGVIGDFARTLESPANALRILEQQLLQLGRAIGSVFLPILAQAMPYVQAFVKVVTDAVKSFAILLGFKMPEWDASSWNSGSTGIEDTATALGDATSKAKEYKKSLQGFDELNIIPAQQEASSSGSGSSVGTGGDLGLDIESVWDKAMIEGITTQADKLAEKMKDVLWYVGAIGLGITGWKLTKFITNLGIVKNKLGEISTMKLAIGIGLSLAGVTLEIKGVLDSIQEGLNATNMLEMIGGGGILVAGASLIGKTFGNALIGGAIGGIIAGIPLLFAGLYSAFTEGINTLSTTMITLATGLIGTGIGLLVPALTGPIGALIGVVVGLVTSAGIWLYQNWDAVVLWFSQGLNSICQFFSEKWTEITTLWGELSTWFDTTVIQPVVGFFSDMWTNISQTASDCWNSVVEFFKPAYDWFSELFNSVKQTVSDVFYNIGVIASGCWTIIKEIWGIVSDWFNTNIVQPVGNFFSGLWNTVKTTAINSWNGIKSTFSTIGEWINTNIVQPVGKFFSNLWNGFLQKGKDAWEGIKSVFSTVAKFFKDTFSKAWQGVVKIFSVGGEIFTNIKDGILSGFKYVVNQLIKGLNKVIAVPFKGINSALSFIKDIEFFGLQPFSKLKSINIPEIPLLANGGMLNTGQMFIARESGPELVGQIGNRTTVANNEQIVAGISQGVYQAMMRAGGNGKEITINVYPTIDGKEVGKAVVKYHNGVVQQTGLSPLII